MDKPAEKTPAAWQPFTARGVAAFTRASIGRVLIFQFTFALLAAAIVIWFVRAAWFPVITAAIQALPEKSEIRNSRLAWTKDTPQRLAENKFLAIAVDLNHEGRARSPAHLQLEFGSSTFKLLSLAGFMEAAYPRGWRVGLNRPEAEPWWGAWSPVGLALIGIGTVMSLMAAWSLLAAVYMWPAWLAALISERELGLAGSWRLASAALLPGALFLSGAILCYGLGVSDLLQLGLAAGLHFLIGWGYLAAAIWRLPAVAQAPSKSTNPFSATGG